ncbi:MAG TPA: hypothetical protein PKJ98_11390 [Verrucomicrobiota bacterium]|nr:hypothetical protein [Verrucomicrobiota bacterium]
MSPFEAHQQAEASASGSNPALLQSDIVVDATTQPVALALAKVIRALLNLKLHAVWTATERREAIQFLLQRAAKAAKDRQPPEGPWLVIQELALEGFPPADPLGVRRWLASSATPPSRPDEAAGPSEPPAVGIDLSQGHALSYRLPFDLLAGVLGGSQAHPGAAFGAFSLPIIYLGLRPLPPESGDLLFLDSSIWHRYAALPESLSGVIELIREAKRYTEERRYHTAAALERLDHDLRKLLYQRLPDFGEDSHHLGWMNLAAFHSETSCSQAARTGDDQSLPCRFLLVDDFGAQSLPTVFQEPGSTSKQRAILAALEPGGEQDDWVIAETLDKAQELLRGRRRYDIVLLDYQLERRAGTAGAGELPSRGTDLIRWLDEADAQVVRAGVDNRFWIFPVSAFAPAFFAEMQSGRVQNVNTCSLVAVGADPLCTPGLFRHALLHLREAMQSAAGLRIGHAIPTASVRAKALSLLPDWPEPLRGSEIRRVAQARYAEVVQWRAMLDRLAEAAAGPPEESSPFAGRAIALWAPWRDFLGRLSELLRLVGWAPGMEWPQMRAELHRLEIHLSKTDLPPSAEDTHRIQGFLAQAVKVIGYFHRTDPDG